MSTAAYRDVLSSPRWRMLKWRVILRQGFACAGCGRAYRGRNVRGALRFFELHHRHYETVGAEDFADVQALCATCHRLEHDKIPEALA